jgi:putative copper resistance protein D
MEPMDLSLDPGAILLFGVAIALYARGVAILRRRGHRIGTGQQACWYVGIGLQAFALLGPLDPLADELVGAHMAQHLLLADIAVPFLLVGLRTPMLVFFLPRPALVPLARAHWLRVTLSTLVRPLVAVPVYVVVLYAWHVPALFEGALRHPLLHALQHLSFIAIGVLVWWSALEPHRGRLHGDLWKIPYIFSVRMASMFLAMAFLFARSPLYEGFYGDAARKHGFTPVGDQQLAGGLMMTLDIVIVVSALAFFFWSAAKEDDREVAAEAAAAAAAEQQAAVEAEPPARPRVTAT